MRIFLRVLLGLLLVVVLIAVVMNGIASSQRGADADYHQSLPRTIRLETGKISGDSVLAQDCTCKGAERSPDLYWGADLPNIKSFAVVMTDPDVPSPAFPLFNLTHWVVYDIPAMFSNLPEGLLIEQAMKYKAQFGKNSLGDLKYIGPCPPIGKHVYLFRVYALDKRLEPTAALDKEQLMDAMKGHILAYGELKTYYAAD
ncbi:MAG: YbhB/YbcL family Raf kinase inhibitor-like protein [Bacteroidetes bacterium]|nr:YbhB/YbcL family Raf kinase inhibitor-like protein [Fibrella sp.]